MAEFSILDLLDLDLKENNHLKLTCIAGRWPSRKLTNSKTSRPDFR